MKLPMKKFIQTNKPKQFKISFKKLLQKLEPNSSIKQPNSSLLLSTTNGFADFLPNRIWEWFVSNKQL